MAPSKESMTTSCSSSQPCDSHSVLVLFGLNPPAVPLASPGLLLPQAALQVNYISLQSPLSHVVLLTKEIVGLS